MGASIRSYANALEKFLRDENLIGVDAIGFRLGARITLELLRRGEGYIGNCVAISPTGFWIGWEKHYFYVCSFLSVRLLQFFQPLIKLFTHNPIGRTLLFPQFFAHPWRLNSDQIVDEVRGYFTCTVFDSLLYQLVYGEKQKGTGLQYLQKNLSIIWGKKDRIFFPLQAKRAAWHFPDANLIWLKHSGHFPHWDEPLEIKKLIKKTFDQPKFEIKQKEELATSLGA